MYNLSSSLVNTVCLAFSLDSSSRPWRSPFRSPHNAIIAVHVERISCSSHLSIFVFRLDFASSSSSAGVVWVARYVNCHSMAQCPWNIPCHPIRSCARRAISNGPWTDIGRPAMARSMTLMIASDRLVSVFVFSICLRIAVKVSVRHLILVVPLHPTK